MCLIVRFDPNTQNIQPIMFGLGS